MRLDITVTAALAAVAIGAAACGGASGGRATSTAAPSATAAAPTATVVASTVSPPTVTVDPPATRVAVPPATAVATEPELTPPTPGPTVETLASPDTVTLDDDGATVTMHVGERFVLSLGDDIYDWNVEVTNDSVVGRVVNITVVRGAQGVYEARAAGEITLTATGDPQCRSATPACELPSRVFHIQVVVS